MAMIVIDVALTHCAIKTFASVIMPHKQVSRTPHAIVQDARHLKQCTPGTIDVSSFRCRQLRTPKRLVESHVDDALGFGYRSKS